MHMEPYRDTNRGCIYLREGSPPKKIPTKQKRFAQTVCANSFCLVSEKWGEKNEGQFVQTAQKLFAQNCVFIWVRVFWGESPSRDMPPFTKKRAYFRKSIGIEMEAYRNTFSQVSVSGSGMDVIFLTISKF